MSVTFSFIKSSNIFLLWTSVVIRATIELLCAGKRGFLTNYISVSKLDYVSATISDKSSLSPYSKFFKKDSVFIVHAY